MAIPSSVPSVLTPIAPQPATPADSIVKSGTWTTEHIMTYVSMLLSALYLADVIPTSGVITKVCAVAAIMLGNLGYQVTRTLVKTSAHKVMIAEHSAIAALAQRQLFALAQVAAASNAAAEVASARVAQAGKINLRPLFALATLATIALSIALFVTAFTGCTPAQRASAGATAHTMSGDFAACAKADLGQIIVQNGAHAGATLLQVVAGDVKLNASDLEDALTKLAATVGVDGVTCAISAVEAVLTKSPTALPTTGEEPPSPGLVRAITWRANHAHTTATTSATTSK